MTGQLRVLRFDGIHPDTLGHYFSALGLLAAVAQRWPDVRGCWRGRRFVLLHESLTLEAVRVHLLDTWKPTPYVRWWGDAQSSKDDANLWAERNERTLTEINVMEAQLVGTKQNYFNPIFGDGGIVGRRDFAKLWGECLKRARPASSGGTKDATKKTAKPAKTSEARRKSESWLEGVLSGTDTAELPTIKAAGTWFVFANKVFNTGQDWYREGMLAPWSFLLAAEGGLLLVGDVNRRLSARARPYAVFPFVCDPAQPTTAGEVGMSRGEFWAPLWDCPATLTEVRQLLKRGLARIGNRSAQAPHEFAIAALAAGTDAGVAEFVRFDLRQTTSAKVYEAVPQEHITVSRVGEKATTDRLAASELLSPLVPWMNRIRPEPRDAKQRGRFRGLRGPVERAIIQITERPDAAERWQRLLLLLAETQSRIDRNKSFREEAFPVPRLPPAWFNRAWPEHLHRSEEILLARAIASVGAGTTYPILLNLFGVELGRNGKVEFTNGDRPPRVVWSDGDPLRVLFQLLQRRLLDAEPGKPTPVGGTQTASVGIIARLLGGDDFDLEQVVTWIPALSLIDWRAGGGSNRLPGSRHAGDLLLFWLFRPIFHERPHRLDDRFPKEPKPSLARRILHLIQFSNLDEAVQLARGYYRAAGLPVVDPPPVRSVGDNFVARLSAALLVPLDDREIQKGLARWLVPEKVTPS